MKADKKDKGVAGLTVLLSVVTSIFVIGLLVMIFTLMGTSLSDETDVRTASVDIVNETLTTVDDSGEDLSVATFDEVVCTAGTLTNASDGVILLSGNFTQSNCNFVNATPESGGYDLNVTYSYIFTVPSVASGVMDNTTLGIAGTTTWFPIFIVITAMVVLILLTVIIITSIRGSGLMGAGGQQQSGRRRGGGSA